MRLAHLGAPSKKLICAQTSLFSAVYIWLIGSRWRRARGRSHTAMHQRERFRPKENPKMSIPAADGDGTPKTIEMSKTDMSKPAEI
jgi:hypothetical protein